MMRCLFIILFLLVAAVARAVDDGPILPCQTSWLGNSFGYRDRVYMQQNLSGIWVRPDGTVFAISQYDEGHQSAGIYKDGRVLGRLRDTVLVGGRVITGDADFVWASIEGYVRRYRQDGAPAPYPDGSPAWTIGKGEPYVTRGLAVVGDEIFVSDANGTIRVFDKRTKNPVRSWPLERPGKIAAAADGSLWIIQRKEEAIPGRIRHFTTGGAALPESLTDASSRWDPVGLCFDLSGALLVADDGPDQQIKIFRQPAKGSDAPDGRLGATGGIYSGVRGRVEPLKFNGPVDVGVDGAGNVYVAQDRFGPDLGRQGHGAGAILESYTAEGKRRWELHALEFVDGAGVDRGSMRGQEMDVYTKLSRYHLDLGRREAGSEATYAAHTLDRFRFPNDPRLRRQPQNGDFTYAAFVRTIRGQRFVFNAGMWSRFLECYRFDRATAGEIAIPCVVFNKQADDGYGAYLNNPADGQWIWTDANGDGNMDRAEFVSEAGQQPNVWGWWVDSTGDVWRTVENRIEHFPLQGLDGHGTPQWSFASRTLKTTPTLFAGRNGNMRRIEVFPAAGEGVAILNGYTEWPGGADPKEMGSKLACYDRWNTDAPVLRWAVDIAWSRTVTTDIPEGMASAGDYIFITYSGFSTNAHEGELRVYRAGDGSFVGRIVPGPEVGNHSGAGDVPYGISALMRSPTEYLIFVEEDNNGKVLLYRWNPLENPKDG